MSTSPSKTESSRQMLFDREKALLDTFLEHHAIDKRQYLKSLTDLIQKMGVKDYSEIEESADE